ncbi:outer membrane protein assembly factor BamB family protein [Cellulomonas sp. P5_E12]
MPGRMHEVELVEAADEPARSRSASRPRTWTPRAAQHVDVELDDDVDARERDDTDRHVLAARSWLRRHGRWLVPVAAGLAVALVATQVTMNHREAVRLAALAAIPGVVPPADASIDVLWRADARLGAALRSGSVVSGTLVGGVQDASGALSLVGLDPDTGAQAWKTPVGLPDPPQPTVGTSPSVWVSCTAVPHGGTPVAACLGQLYGDEAVVGVPGSSVWVLDPADGTVLSHRIVPGTTGLTFTQDDLVVAERVADDGSPAPTDASSVRWAVTASDAVSGETAWTWTSPSVDVLGREDGPAGSGATLSAALQTVDDDIVVTVDEHAWILTTDGHQRRDIPLDPGSWLGPARAGVFVENVWSSSDLFQGTVLLADGTEIPVDEAPGYLAVDDGSAPGAFFTVGSDQSGADGLTARSVGSGTVLWHLPGSIVAGLLLDGILYVAMSNALVAVDATTGRTQWRTPLDYLPQQLSTDGRYLLVPGLGVTLDAFELRDGALAWHKDLAQAVAGDRDPVFVQGFQSGWHDPRLYVWMDSGAVAVLG